MINRLVKRLSSPSIDRSLRLKITLGIILPMLLMLGIFTLFEYTHHRSVLLDNLSRLASYNGQVIESTLEHSMLTSDFVEVQRILDTVGKNENFRVVYLVDTSGKVIFAPNEAGKGLVLDNRDPTCQPCHRLSPAQRPSGVVVDGAGGQRVFRSMQPIENAPACKECHDPSQRLIGLLLTDIAVAPFEDAFVSDLRENFFWGSLTILVSAIVTNLVLDSLVIRRLKRVAAALAGFGSGKRDVRLSPNSQDEIGQLEADFNQMGQQIQADEAEKLALAQDLRRQAAQQQELLKRLITAQEDERKRVARELHDELGQSLSGLALHTEALEQFIDSNPQRALEQSSLIREQIGKTTQQMYDLILALRPSVLDDLGLAAALRAYADRVLQGSGITFELDQRGMSARLPPAVETTLYRVFQEALNNVVKHSGADQAKITLSRSDGLFEGQVLDNGHGFNPETAGRDVDSPHGLGLLGMQERLAQCGGSMKITSQAGKGTNIYILVPLVQAKDE